ncbi:MAG: iron ABC transporter permease [Thermoplasmata archaeon]|jgi:iron complex transport system permease protein|nr:iron ABC transporter permease [Thermoplasmata archaeon]
MAKIKYRNGLKNLGQKLRLSDTARKHHLGNSENQTEEIISQYRAYKYAKAMMLLVVFLLCALAFGIDIGLGPYSIDFLEVYRCIIDRLTDWGQDLTNEMFIVWELRMPRVLTAFLAGVGLAMAGAAMQSMMKNPLADPYTTGISSGAALGATLAITMGICIVGGEFGTVINAFVFALIPAAVIVLISTYRRPSPAMIILTGISLMYIFNAAQSYLMIVADPNSASAVYNWTVGSLNNASWDNVPFIFAVSLIGGTLLMQMARILNTMNSGDAYSKSIGIDVNKSRIIVLVTISLVAAGIISFTGIIGFIGLVAPHIARIFVGSDNKILIPAAGLMGAGLMLLADCAVQLVAETMPIGIITSLIGGPIFMILILKQKKEVW